MHKLTALALTAALAFAPAMASATTTITYTGVIGDIHTTNDFSVYFGAGVTYGTAYSLVYTIADGAPGSISNPDAYTRRFSGSGAVTAVMTINGQSQSVGGTAASHVSVQDGKPNGVTGVTDEHGVSTQDYLDNGTIYSNRIASNYISSYLTDFIQGKDYTTPLTYVPVGGDSYGGEFIINDYNFATKQGQSIFLNLSVDHITVASMNAVPEPASWALMIGGFALAGGAMRRRGAGKALRFA